MKKCNENSRKLLKINMKMHMQKALNDSCMRLLGIGGYVVILLIGYRFIQDRILAFSDVVYCFQIRGSIITGMSMLLTCVNNLKANSVCIKRIRDIYE